MKRAICLGEILIHCFAEQPGLSRREMSHWTPLPGGSPANVACALVKLGNRADFIGAVGNDPWGNALINLLSDMGVGHAGVQRRRKAPTRQVYITLDETGDRTFSGFSESDPTLFADAHLFADSLSETLLIGADFLVLSTLSLAYTDTRESVAKAAKLATANQTSILVDVNWQPMFWPSPAEAPSRVYDLIKKAQFLKVTEEEAEWLFGTVSAKAIARQFPHLKGVLVTASEQGCQYWLTGNSGHIPAFKVDVEETIGAGDAFTAGFVHQVMQKGIASLADESVAREVVTYASAVGALTTTRLGAIAALPSPKEVEVFLYLN